MNMIIFPLGPGQDGPAIRDLQDGLLFLLERGVLIGNDEPARQEQIERLQREREAAVYGEVTGKLIDLVQEMARLDVGGEVDGPTARVLNEWLEQYGAFGSQPSAAIGIVTGKVWDEDGDVVKGVKVRAAHEADDGPIRLGEDVTDADGDYTIRYENPPGVNGVVLQLAALGENGEPWVRSEIVPNARTLERIDLTMPAEAPAQNEWHIEGVILFDYGLPAEQLKLRLYRHDFGGKAIKLDETKTRSGGRYAFAYDTGGRTASLEIRAVHEMDDKETPLSRALDNLEPRAEVNLVAPGTLKPLASEYSRLVADLTPHVGEMTKLAGAKEGSEQRDLTVLNRATRWDARLIALASVTERLAVDPDVGLPSEALYGLLRAGLPSDKLLLAQVEPDVVGIALKKVRDTGIIDVSDTGIDDIKTKFGAFTNKTRLSMPVPGSRSTYGELLRASSLPQEIQGKFASIYLKHRGSGGALWDEARKAGLDGAQIGKLQLQGKLAFLAGNSEEMTTRLLNGGLKDPVELVERDFHGADAWKNEVFAQAGIPPERRAALTEADRKQLEAVIPDAYAAEKVELRLEAYAEDMARKVRLSYPTQVLGRLIETDEKFKLASSHAATVKLLKGATAQGFRLGETPAPAFLKSNAGLQGDLNEAEFQAAGQQLKMLQRVYQITPINEAMPVLTSLGMGSAFDVMAYPEEQFHVLFKDKYLEIHQKPAPVGVPELIIRKAKQVSSITYNLFTIAKKLDSEPQVGAMSAPLQVRESVKNELIKHYPTMESLFGSMDYCECEHCRSVLSPAAYLVDLLQFVDIEPEVWGNFLAQWKKNHRQDYPHKNAAGQAMKPYDVLIERRPDLPYIALTCENTNTALPYIDIVNEILEYYVANGKLEKAAAHDTGDATTAELLAEPQNVIREAYDELGKARYPLNLPFDLWIETARQFCNYFETPLHNVLETFRPTDELFAPAQTFDHAAIFMESLGLSPAEVAIFDDTDPLGNDRWHDLYGYPPVRTAIQNSTNVNNATMSIANDDAAKLSAGVAYTYFDASANALNAESKILASVGAPDSGGAGQTTLIFEGIWAIAPVAGDLLVCDAVAMLKSAKTLSRRLGVTYKEIVEIVQTGFVNPDLGKLGVLYKLDVGVGTAKLYKDEKAFYEANQDFYEKNTGKSRSDLDPVSQQQYDDLAKKRPSREITGWDVLHEVTALERRFIDLAAAFKLPNVDDLRTAILAIPFEGVLLLADPDAGCNFDLTTLIYADGSNVDPIVFLRINLFVRLWRKLGWSIEETDRALTTFIPQSARYDSTATNLIKQPLKTALIYLAHLKALDEKLKVGKQSRLQLLTLWSDIATTGKKPLYAQLFLNRSVLKTSPVFDHPLGQYLNDPNVKIKDHMLVLQGALGLTADEIGRIFADAENSVAIAELSLKNVSLLYRYGLLAKVLKLSVNQLITLKQLSGFDPFKALHPDPFDPLTSLDQDYPFSQTLEFVKVTDEIKDSGMTIEDLDYLLRHRFDETGKYRPDPDGTLALLKVLAEGVRAIRTEHAVPSDAGMLSEDALRKKLGLALPPDVVERFLGMVNGTAEFTASTTGVEARGDLPVALQGAVGIQEVSYDKDSKEQILKYRGVLFDKDKTVIIGKLASATQTQKTVLQKLLTNIQKQAFANITQDFIATLDNVPPANQLPSAKFAGSTALLVSYDQGQQVQSLTYHGILTDQEKAALKQKFESQLSPEQMSVFERLLDEIQSKITATISTVFTARASSITSGGELPLSPMKEDRRVRDTSYDLLRQEQKLTVQGVLRNENEKAAMKSRFDAALTEAQKQAFATLLDGVQKLTREFFDNQLKKQRLRLDGEAGFLEETDFDALFSPLEPLKEILPTDSPVEADSKRDENEKIDKKNQKDLQTRHNRIAQAFLPLLQQRLIRQFVVQTMTARTGADPVLVESFVADDRLLVAPKALLDAFAATAQRGLNATFWASADGTGPALPTVLLSESDTGATDEAGNRLKPDGVNSARLEAYLEVPATGAYRFYAELDRQNAQAQLRFRHLPEPVFVKDQATADHATLGDQPSEYLELKAGVLYHFSLDLKHLNGGNARLLVQGEMLSKGPLSQLTLYPAAVIEAAAGATTLLSKALQLVQSMGLSEREIRYLLTHAADFDNFSLSELPAATVGGSTDEVIATAKRFGRFRRLAAYARLKRCLADGSDDLIGIFEASPTLTAVERKNVSLAKKLDENAFSAHPKLSVRYEMLNNIQRLTYDGTLSDAEAAAIKQLLPGSELLASLVDELQAALPEKLKRIAKLTRRADSVVKACATALLPVVDIRNESSLWRIWEALQVVERFGVPPTSLLGWADIVNRATVAKRRFELARDMKEAIKAHFEPENWRRVAQPIFDKLRQRQRDALVSYVMHRHGFDRMEQLYEYFLIDPGMEPVVQTSRIRLAISSLQLFIQRCFLNLERKVPPHPDLIKSKQWEWMKRYRVWEANRKIFLFPENWLEPEFRDDKTHLFTELEGALLQGDVSSDLVEDAFLNYLRKLDELARLDICAMHIEDNPDPALRTLHVFGRTYSQPHKYYYRRYVQQTWTPWEPVSAEIEGDHLAPVVWRDRLYLFWVTFMDKPAENGKPAEIKENDDEKAVTALTMSEVIRSVANIVATKMVDVQLHWSEYLQGEWSTRESGGFSPVISTSVSANFESCKAFIHVSKEYDPTNTNTNTNSAELGIFVHLGDEINSAFYLAGRNSTPEAAGYGAPVPAIMGFFASGPVPENKFISADEPNANRHKGHDALTVSFRERTTTDPQKTSEPSNRTILQQGGGYTLQPCNNNLTLGASEDAYQNAADPATVKAAIESGLPEIASLIKPVFYQDNRHTFFVEPDVTERTIEEWQEWVTRSPAPDPGWKAPNWWKKIVVIPDIPRKWPVPEPGDPWRFSVDPGSIIQPVPDRDWLVNPGSVVMFDDVLIGPAGQSGIEIHAGREFAAGGRLVKLNPGSGGESHVVVRDERSFGNSELAVIGGGLNVVGGAGLTSALRMGR